MVLPGIIFEKQNLKLEQLPLNQEQFHHFINVMRMKSGDPIHVSNGVGSTSRGILSVEKKSALVLLDNSSLEIHSPPVEICLAVGIAKDAAFENLLRQTTELGVTTIIPVIFSYSSVSEKIFETRRSRFEKIIISACEQCRTPFKPSLEPVYTLDDLTQLRKYQKHIVFYEKAKMLFSNLVSDKNNHRDVKDAIPPSFLAVIGPEGGITENEMERLEKNNFIPILFNTNILRVDTAATAVVTLLRNF